MAKQPAGQKIHGPRSPRSKASRVISKARTGATDVPGLTGTAKRSKSEPKKTHGSGMNDKALREHLVYLLSGGGAHVDFEKAIANLPPGLRGKKVSGFDQSVWRLLEHMRIAQWDILEFSRNPKHASPDWPGGYWPANDAPPNDKAWQNSIRAFHADLQAMQNLVSNPASDLFAPFPHGDGQTLLREAVLIADHNAYHLGQIVMLRRLLGAWTE